MRRRVVLKPELLEDRAQPSVFGSPWPNADRLTLSFAPDGARVAGASREQLAVSQSSGLFAALAAAGPEAAWQEEVLRGFQAWAVHTNINVGLVLDPGSPFGP